MDRKRTLSRTCPEHYPCPGATEDCSSGEKTLDCGTSQQRVTQDPAQSSSTFSVPTATSSACRNASCPEAGGGLSDLRRARELQDRAAPFHGGGRPHIPSPGDGPSPCRVHHGTSGPSGPLTFFQHSVSLLSPLASPELLQEHGEPCSLPLVSLSGRGTGYGEGKRREFIVPQPNWEVWTQAASHGRGEHPASCP